MQLPCEWPSGNCSVVQRSRAGKTLPFAILVLPFHCLSLSLCSPFTVFRCPLSLHCPFTAFRCRFTVFLSAVLLSFLCGSFRVLAGSRLSGWLSCLDGRAVQVRTSAKASTMMLMMAMVTVVLVMVMMMMTIKVVMMMTMMMTTMMMMIINVHLAHDGARHGCKRRHQPSHIHGPL